MAAPNVSGIALGQDGMLYATTASKRTYRWDQDAKSWVLVMDGSPTWQHRPVVLSTARGPRVFGLVTPALPAMVLDPGAAQPIASSFNIVQADPTAAGAALAAAGTLTARTTDGGDTWATISFPGTAPVTALAVHPTSSGTEYFALSTDGLYRLPPDGAWSLVGPGHAGDTLVISVGGSVLAADLGNYAGEVWRLAPGEATWSSVNLFGLWPYGLSAATAGDDRVLVGTGNGALASGNGGASFVTIDTVYGGTSNGFVLDPADRMHLWAAMGNAGVVQTWSGIPPFL